VTTPPTPAARADVVTDVVTDGLDVLEIVALPIRCMIGIHPHERQTPQDLVVSLRLHTDVSVAADRADLTATVDYSRLAAEVTFLVQRGRFLLIESVAVAIAKAVLHGQPRVELVEVLVEKPAALGGQGFPRLHLRRRRAQSSPARLIVLHEASGADEQTLQRLTLPAGATWPVHNDVEIWSVDAGNAGELASEALLEGGDPPRSYVIARRRRGPEAG
jgi:FolB domain-containing protein